MKFIINAVVPNICEITGNITYQISVFSQDRNREYLTQVFNNNPKLLVLKNLEFEITYPSYRKITEFLIDAFNESISEYNTPNSLVCPVCNNPVYCKNDSNYCVSLLCPCNDIEKTVYNQIKTIFPNIDYNFFKTFIFNIMIGYCINKIDLLFVFRTLFNQQLSFEDISTKDQYHQLMMSFANMKPSTFFKLCKCPAEYHEVLSVLDLHILDIRHLYNILSIDSDNYKSDIFPTFGIIEDKQIEPYLRLVFKINFDFIKSYIGFISLIK